MQLVFKYDLQKDTENFLKSFRSINNKRPTKLQELYMKEVGGVDTAKVPEFLERQGIDAPTKLREIETEWRAIESAALQRMEILFGTPLPQPVTVYLSTNSRCTYNIEQKYFFVYINSPHTNGIIVHELLHFYTWFALHQELDSQGVSRERYNDIKESLTELLNTDFSNLLVAYHDDGYPQHREMRERIRSMRQEGKTVREMVLALAA
jgi:hypothetical protein